MIMEEVRKAIVRVGDGRGFVVDADGERFVITAAHCLPHFPPCHGLGYAEERTYANLLGALDDSEPEVWAECRFADPIADIAVLGEPDHPQLFDQTESYWHLTDQHALEVGTVPDDQPRRSRVSLEDLALGTVPEGPPPRPPTPAWLMALDGSWFRCDVSALPGKPLRIPNATRGIVGGMSGSPILNEDSEAVGVVCLAGGSGGETLTEGGPNPRLSENLPAWLVRSLLGRWAR